MFVSYVAALLRQLETWGEGTRPVTSVYFGGGTPSLLSMRLVEILEELRQNFALTDDCEITMEANPDSFDARLAVALKHAGVTRVSLGIQSLDDEMLCLLGRRHTAQQALKSLRIAKATGMRVSADIMCGLPKKNISFGPLLKEGSDHISVYPLTLEDDTPLAQQVEVGTLTLPGEDAVALEMERLEELLTEQGYLHYEIANYARPGQESRHNLRYWLGGDYLGFGPSAASMLNNPDGGRYRFTLHKTLEDYVREPGRTHPDELEELTVSQARREDLMLALRTYRGVSLVAAQTANLLDTCEELRSEGLLEYSPETAYYRCTRRGWMVGNEVFSRVWCLDA